MKRLIGFEKGVNLGGWLSQHKFDQEHIKNFIKEEDIRRIKDMGCDHVRLPVDFDFIYDEVNRVDNVIGYKYIDLCVNWCKNQGLNVVLDLHKAPGYVFDNNDYSKEFFHNDELQELFLDIWDRLSFRYSKYSDMMMFEMLNEVNDISISDEWNDLAFRAIKVIRKNAPKVKILYGSVHGSSAHYIKCIPLPYDENIVFNIHCYEPIVFTHQGAYWIDGMVKDYKISYPMEKERFDLLMKQVPLYDSSYIADNEEFFKMFQNNYFIQYLKEAVEYAEQNNVSLYCGEYGVINLADVKSSINWLKDINKAFNYYHIGRAIWSYKEMDFGIIDDHYKENFKELIKYL